MQISKHLHNESGSSLIIVMISLGVASIATLVIMTMIDNLNKANLNATQTAEATYLHSDIYSVLRDPNACTRSFLDLVINDMGSGYEAVSKITRGDGSTAFQVGNLTSSGKLSISEMKLGEFLPNDAAVTSTGKAYLNVTIEKQGQPSGPKSIFRSVQIQVTRNPASKKLINCVAISGTKDVWLLNTDGSIFYPGGSVGIGSDLSNPPSMVNRRIAEQIFLQDGGKKSSTIQVQTECCAPGVSNNPNFVIARSYANSDLSTSTGSFVTQIAQGTAASPTAVRANRLLGSFAAAGYDGSSFNQTDGTANGPAISFFSTEDFTSTKHGSKIVLSTISNGSTNRVPRLHINENGLVNVGNSSVANQVSAGLNAAEGILAAGFSNNSGIGMGQAQIEKEIGTWLFYPIGGTPRVTSGFYYAPQTAVPGASGSGATVVKGYRGADIIFALEDVSGGPSPVSNPFIIRNNGTITMAGNVGVGTDPVGSNRLSVWGDSNFNGNIVASGNISASGTITAASDERLKTDIQPLNHSLERILRLQGVSFVWKNKDLDQRRHLGLVAQSTESVFPESVWENAKGMKSIDYMGLIGAIIEAIKELTAMLRSLTSDRVAKLEQENASMKAYLCARDPRAPFCEQNK